LRAALNTGVIRGDVDLLVIIYSFSVFVTFLLSQAGMVK